MHRSEHAKIYCLLLGKHIKNLRKEKNITLKEISQKTGIKIQYLMNKLSMGGLEPPQISPHAPQTCASTIPPHRHTY